MLKAFIVVCLAKVFACTSEDRYYKWQYGYPEERGPYPEGDLLIPVSKNGIKSEAYRWTNGIIPYEIQSGFSKYDQENQIS